MARVKNPLFARRSAGRDPASPALTLDGPDQVWASIRIGDRRLVAATPAPGPQQQPHPDGAPAGDIRSLVWRGETLYARVRNMEQGEQGRGWRHRRLLRRTMDARRRLESVRCRVSDIAACSTRPANPARSKRTRCRSGIGTVSKPFVAIFTSLSGPVISATAPLN